MGIHIFQILDKAKKPDTANIRGIKLGGDHAYDAKVNKMPF
jgi:hypothetical protein